MSYKKFKRTKSEFANIFSSNTKVSVVREVGTKDVNLVLSSEAFIATLKPIQESMGVGTDKVTMSYQYLEEFTTINNMYLK